MLCSISTRFEGSEVWWIMIGLKKIVSFIVSFLHLTTLAHSHCSTRTIHLDFSSLYPPFQLYSSLYSPLITHSSFLLYATDTSVRDTPTQLRPLQRLRRVLQYRHLDVPHHSSHPHRHPPLRHHHGDEHQHYGSL